ncbi:TlpA family protein disulfide reductase [Ktedonosporobacter rubrisoli]|uniref:TlpA family protein disulfide reductase n=1 Tax=Ktedonosporobacter rubrisoli TaxID=2509675 RepID=A0A4P6JYC6_KTERU|nr:TlpA disulfide reductase family protein [Ktedonosporobacter rubrisoli]QBD80525.1 TlpA family protein disulfide reductase [Ktedonosporobacter rubrisoli]
MARTLTRIIMVAAALATLAIISLGLLHPAPVLQPASQATRSGQPAIGYQVGEAAPNFTLARPDGKKVSLSDYRGKIVLLNFWRIDCEGCIIEMPGLQKVYAEQQAARHNFVILGINSTDNAQAIQTFMQRRGLTYPVVLDPSLAVSDLYHINGVPASFLLDSQGIVSQSIAGPFEEHALEQALAGLNA